VKWKHEQVTCLEILERIHDGGDGLGSGGRACQVGEGIDRIQRRDAHTQTGWSTLEATSDPIKADALFPPTTGTHPFNSLSLSLSLHGRRRADARLMLAALRSLSEQKLRAAFTS
jgi:hypothetical protein